MKRTFVFIVFFSPFLSGYGQSTLGTIDVPSDPKLVRNANGLYNHQGDSGKILSTRWWIYATEFSHGVAVVHKKNSQNFLLKDGKFLLRHWYRTVLNDKGLLIVWKSDQYFNFADITFPDLVLYNKWFWVSEYDNIVSRERERKQRKIKKKGTKR